MDRFYSIVTGQDDAFYKLCMALPNVIQNVVDSEGTGLVPNDTVSEELKLLADGTGVESKELALSLAIYMLGFSSYSGFQSLLASESIRKLQYDERISEYLRALLFSDDV